MTTKENALLDKVAARRVINHGEDPNVKDDIYRMGVDPKGNLQVKNMGQGQAPSSVGVGNSSTEIVPANASRQWLILTNIGIRDVYLAVGTPAIFETGIMLGAGGGSIVFGVDINTTEAINAIKSGGADQTITFQEANFVV